MPVTLQEFYDRTIAHLRSQGRPSLNEQKLPVFHGPNGLKCVAGYWIPDSEYNPLLDVYPRRATFPKEARSPTLTAVGESVGREAFLEMYRLHDNCFTNPDGTFDLENLESRARAYCIKFSISYSETADA